MVTSRAVVGSSAISSSGSPDRAMAIMTRWRIPPESWWGYSSTRFPASGMPTSSSSSMARSRAAFLSRPLWSFRDSEIWSPMVNTGFREVMGSWKIMEIRLPRSFRISFSGRVKRSWPSKTMLPPSFRPVAGSTRRMIDRLVTLLPQPDSPTMPNVFPLSREKVTPSTALATPESV